MGEARKDALRVNFDRKLKLEFHGVKVTSDAGLLSYRELDVSGSACVGAREWPSPVLPGTPFGLAGPSPIKCFSASHSSPRRYLL